MMKDDLLTCWLTAQVKKLKLKAVKAVRCLPQQVGEVSEESCTSHLSLSPSSFSPFAKLEQISRHRVEK